jgi:hypothetical protein
MTKSESKQAKGGKARATALSPETRAEIASKAARARWSAPKATHQGVIHIGDLTIDCAVLPDGRRVLSQRSLGRALGRGYGGQDWKRSNQVADEDGGGKLPFFLSAKTLRPFISSELLLLASKPIQYQHSQGGGVAHGSDAVALPQICDVWLKARDAHQLSRSQEAVAQRADMLMRGLAHVGIVALVDEATGYQEVRDRQALQAILDKFLAKELAAWAKRFPDEFYKEIFRLRKWKWNSLRRPGVVAAWTKDLVYARLAPGVLEELERRNPMTASGRRATKHHQWLSDDVGHPALAQHLHAVIGLMRASDNWDGFKSLIDRAFPKRGSNMELEFG